MLETRRTLLGFSGYQWLLIAAGWAGWGFDVYDALRFNFVAPNCIPRLLHLTPGSAQAHSAVAFWTGAITAAAGGSSRSLTAILAWLALAVLLAALLARWVMVETRGRALAC